MGGYSSMDFSHGGASSAGCPRPLGLSHLEGESKSQHQAAQAPKPTIVCLGSIQGGDIFLAVTRPTCLWRLGWGLES